jgi:hypothetical protein
MPIYSIITQACGIFLVHLSAAVSRKIELECVLPGMLSCTHFLYIILTLGHNFFILGRPINGAGCRATLPYRDSAELVPRSSVSLSLEKSYG